MFLRRLGHELARFRACCDGNVALLFGLALPVLIGVTGLGMDSAAVYNQRSRMQSAADATALAVGKEMHLFLKKFGPLEESGTERAEALLTEVGLADYPHTVEVAFDEKKAIARVQIAMETKTFLPAEVWGENPIIVSAESYVYGAARLCVLSLKDRSMHVLKMDGSARVTAPDCAVQSNSNDPKGLSAKPLSLLISSSTCSAGGYEGLAAVFLPLPDTDCPALDDPLEMRAPPPLGGCDFNDVTIEEGNRTIQPGHYCGGLTIKGTAQVAADPGIYILSEGRLEVADNASLRGDNVSFYFADNEATFQFTDEAVVELSGPTDGPMAGILFYEDRSAQAEREFKISSDSVRKLIGTIYLPRGIFKASAIEGGLLPALTAPLKIIGAASTYTIIVANKIELIGVNLVINSDYGISDVPVPAGLGPNSANVRLIK